MRSKDMGRSWQMIHEDIRSFGMEGKFLYASVTVPGVSLLFLVVGFVVQLCWRIFVGFVLQHAV